MARLAIPIILIILTVATVLVSWALTSAGVGVVVYHDLSCACCARWKEHLDESGFVTRTEILSPLEVMEFRQRLEIPEGLDACHVAVVQGKFVVGHVAARTIREMLEEKESDLRGVGVIGMPAGSPGMENAGDPVPHEVIGVRNDGSTFIYTSVTYDVR